MSSIKKEMHTTASEMAKLNHDIAERRQEGTGGKRLKQIGLCIEAVGKTTGPPPQCPLP